MKRRRSCPPIQTRSGSFAGFRFPPEVIVLAVRWYLRYGLSYRDLEELLAERGIEVDHVTLYRWVQRFTPLIVEAARPCRHAVGDRWFVDETYVKVAGTWRYVCRAVDQHGQVIDVYVSKKRDVRAATRFFSTAIKTHGEPAEVTTDRSPALARTIVELLPGVHHDTTQYANNRVAADHGRLKARLRPMRGLKRDRTASVVIRGHAFMQNLRRGHYELAIHALPGLTVVAAFDELARAVLTPARGRSSAEPRTGCRRRNSALESQPQGLCCVGRARRVRRGWRDEAPPVLLADPAGLGDLRRFRFPPDVISLAVRWYLRFGLSYRDLEELLAERGIEVDHVTLYRWVQRFTPLLVDAARPCRHAVGDRWFVDETYVKVAGVWRYVYRATDQNGQVIDVYVSKKRDTVAARRFFSTAISVHGEPVEVTTDKARTLAKAISELAPSARHDTTQYANNRVEADHGRLKARLRPMRGLQRDRTASVIIRGHAFIQNLRRGHYELGIDAVPGLRIAAAFDELTRAV